MNPYQGTLLVLLVGLYMPLFPSVRQALLGGVDAEAGKILDGVRFGAFVR